ncbi:hypothetical protein HanPI659440_Chr04g0153351 [Helianthus annuus]|nr:hypothetical protein HanPI659440_Chr04g0153351 [Helianthus annuus]
MYDYFTYPISIFTFTRMDDGFMVEQGTVACSSWICWGRTTRLVALGKSRYGDHPASLQIFKFDPATKSLSSTPSVTYNFEDGCDPVSLAVHPEGNYIVCSTTIGGCRYIILLVLELIVICVLEMGKSHCSLIVLVCDIESLPNFYFSS